MKRLIAGLLVVVGLGACTPNNPPVQILPELSYVHLEPLMLDVAVIDVIDKSKATTEGKNVAYRFPTSPEKAIRNWVNDRLVAAGTSGSAQVTILEATAIETELEKKTGVTGLFTNDQSERYTTAANVRIDVYDQNGNNVAYSAAQTNRNTSLAEDASLLDREKAWFDLVEKMMLDFNSAMETNIKNHLPLK
ncbi:hypothetical protein RYZ26_18500 [Terasakiella sp. A23]|uniref:hypothetical protein n=1 Tax=Terasakiella sp. FCG-A23 TaxID=3080561 RepID=UPI0029553FA6|nr:hypothetical protein [Terasakiella sp. A23]MDV7341601.1 hypothetical protein [Terasakiella sp. A23]